MRTSNQVAAFITASLLFASLQPVGTPPWRGWHPGPGEIISPDMTKRSIISKSKKTPIDAYDDLLTAIGTANVSKVKELLEEDINLTYPDNVGATPIHYAAAICHSTKNSKTIFEMVLDKAKDAIDVKSSEGSTPLHFAAVNGCAENVQVLIDRKADVNAINNFGKAPLHYAASSCSLETVDNLIKANAKVDIENEKDYRRTPLYYAATMDVTRCKDSKHRIEIAEHLIRAGADIYKKEQGGLTLGLLNYAPIDYVKNPTVKQAWLNAYNQMHPTPVTPPAPAPILSKEEQLIEAVKASDFNGVKKAIKDGANLTKADEDGITPLHYAAGVCGKPDSKDILNFVLTNSKDVNAATGEEETPLHFAVKNNCIENVKILINAKAEVNKVDSLGFAPLHYAAKNCNKEMIGALLEVPNIDVDIENGQDYSRTPLHYAAYSGCLQGGILLINKGANINKPEKGGVIFNDTPITLAEIKQSKDFANKWQAAADAYNKAHPAPAPTPKIRKAAGVVPYVINPANGEIKLLLSKGCTVFYREDKNECQGTKLGIPVPGMSSKKYCQDKWTDFGGAIEPKDLKDYGEVEGIKVGAAREAHEETIGYFTGAYQQDADKDNEIKKGISFWKNKLDDAHKVINKAGSTEYTYWFVPIDYPQQGETSQTAELLKRYKAALKTRFVSGTEFPCRDGKGYLLPNVDSYIEKKEYRWVPAQTILDTIKGLKELKDTDNITIQDPENPTEKLELYYRFVNSLIAGRATLQKIVDDAKAAKSTQPQPASQP